MTTTAQSVSGTRYSWGGDDHVVVESRRRDEKGYNAALLGVLRAD
jgi:hypothetical protein